MTRRPAPHRYFGVLAPNSPLRSAVTALAPAATTAPPATTAPSGTTAPPATTAPSATTAPPHPTRNPPPNRPIVALAATRGLLLARIYEVFPLVCPNCGGAMRIIAFIIAGPTMRDILDHLGEPTAPPRIAPARGPPLWEATGAEHDPAADPPLQLAPAFEFDQRITW